MRTSLSKFKAEREVAEGLTVSARLAAHRTMHGMQLEVQRRGLCVLLDRAVLAPNSKKRYLHFKMLTTSTLFWWRLSQSTPSP